MAKILFENKEDVYVDSSIPDKNKVKADDMNNIKEAVNTNENKILLAISDTAPSTCSTGDLYYNTTSKKIFEATGTNTWGTTGTNPTSNTIYILFDTKTTYSYDGTDLVSVGGGGAEISVSTTEPTGEDADSVKIWINPNEAPSGSLNPISNTYGVAQDKGYSQEYINDHLGGVILYDNATGTTGNITLSDSASNYEYLDIYYRDNNDRWSYQRVYQPNGKNVEIDNAYIDNSAIYFRANLISISGTTITKLFYAQFNHEGQNAQNNNANFYITRVVGYK